MPADHMLASTFANELQKNEFTPQAFNLIIARLIPDEPDNHLFKVSAPFDHLENAENYESGSISFGISQPKEVNTATFHLIANQFLDCSKRYKGRKSAIDDILKRQRENAHDHALEQALNKVAV